MGKTDAVTRPDDSELVVIREQYVVLPCARKQLTDDVRHSVIQLIPEYRRPVVVGNTDPVRRYWTTCPTEKVIIVSNGYVNI